MGIILTIFVHILQKNNDKKKLKSIRDKNALIDIKLDMFISVIFH